MANVASPIGFRHLGNRDGASPTFGHEVVPILSTDTTKIFFGDPVQRVSSGYCAQWAAGVAVSQLAGIFVGCEYLSNGGLGWVRSNIWPGAGAVAGTVKAQIIPCNLSVPSLFMVQAVGGTGILFADIGQNVDVTLGTGSTTTGVSAAGVTQSTLATTATLPFRIVGFNGDVGPAITPNGLVNDNTLANNWVYVAANVAGAGSTGV